MSSASYKPTQFVVASVPFYGHARPLLTLSVNLLNTFDTLHITFLTTVPFFPTIQAEIASHDPTPDVLARLRVVAVKTPPRAEELASSAASNGDKDMSKLGEDMGTQLAAFAQALSGVITAIWEGKPVFEAATGKQLPGLAIQPVLAIVDAFMPFWQPIVKASLPAGASLPDLGFFPTSGACFVQHFGKLEQGGKMAYVVQELPKLKAERPDADDGVLMLELYHHSEGKLLTYPAHPPMHDYEFYPQTEGCPMPIEPILALAGAFQTFQQAAGCITTVLPDFESGAADVVGALFGAASAGDFEKRVFQVGPQFTPNQWSGKLHPLKPAEQAVIDFCDSVLAKHGEKSLIYVSFGSLFWPVARPDLITALIDALEAAGKPFLIAGGSVMCSFEPGVKERIAKGGLGMVGGFVPQTHVLAHPATGWFLTHGGSNSLAESLLFEVPLILWPMAADQPMNCALIEQLGNGIQLFQVRTGLNVGEKIASNGVVIQGTREAVDAELKATLELLDGPRGEALRRRAEESSDIQRRSAMSGLAKQELLAFAQFMTA